MFFGVYVHLTAAQHQRVNQINRRCEKLTDSDELEFRRRARRRKTLGSLSRDSALLSPLSSSGSAALLSRFVVFQHLTTSKVFSDKSYRLHRFTSMRTRLHLVLQSQSLLGELLAFRSLSLQELSSRGRRDEGEIAIAEERANEKNAPADGLRQVAEDFAYVCFFFSPSLLLSL